MLSILKALQNKTKVGFLVSKETIWQPGRAFTLRIICASGKVPKAFIAFLFKQCSRFTTTVNALKCGFF
jgi:hypothetical protein